MKVLIFSVSAGGGHNNVAYALKNKITSEDPNSYVKIIDTLKVVNPIIDKLIIGGYLQSLKFSPNLYEKIYNFTDNYDIDQPGATISLLSKISKIFATHLVPLIEKITPDIILCTHPFAAEMISLLKETNEIESPIFTIMTDYAAHNTWIHKNTDGYIVSNEDMALDMMHRGVSFEKIHVLGIPIDQKLLITYSKKETFFEFALDPNLKTVLIMGGSLGLGDISELYETLITSNLKAQFIIICGKNHKLFNSILKLKIQHNHTSSLVLGYTDEVNKLMQSSDLLITKPGGLTITEALINRIPIAIASPLPGQEVKNSEFLLKNNLAIDLSSNKNIINKIKHVLYSSHLSITIRENCAKYAKPNATDDLYLLIKETIDEKKSLN